MSDESSHKAMSLADEIKRKIDILAYEMKDDRNDGWVQHHYWTALHEVFVHLDRVMRK